MLIAIISETMNCTSKFGIVTALIMSKDSIEDQIGRSTGCSVLVTAYSIYYFKNLPTEQTGVSRSLRSARVINHRNF